jgi:hypothetical protein
MSLLPITLPPGIYRSGTEYSSKGRWYDANLVRFYNGTIQPHGGWRVKSMSAFTGKGRAMISWNENSITTWAAIGTHSKLYAMGRDGTLSDITPIGFVAGDADASLAAGYGGGPYGEEEYGTPRPDGTAIQPAGVWTLDLFGKYLLALQAKDGKLYEWQLNTAVRAAAVSGAPSGRACFVTEEGMAVVLAAGSVTRRVQWSDQRNNTIWTPTATNQAGDFDIETTGQMMLGKRANGTNLIWTDRDVHQMDYIGGTLVYGFRRLADRCGAISQNCVAVTDVATFWLGPSGFWTYNGYISPLPCEVLDYVFSDINTLQASKITSDVNSEFGEVTWRYCSSGSTEIDRSVTFNFREGHWAIGQDARLCGVDKQPFAYVLRCANDGYVYEHDVGTDWGGAAPYLEGGPVEIGNGDTIAHVLRIVPDEKTIGDVTVTFKTRNYPGDSESTQGPYTMASPRDVRFSARQARIRFDTARNTSWRVGTFRLDVREGGGR